MCAVSTNVPTPPAWRTRREAPMDVQLLYLAQDQPPPAGASTNPVLNAIIWLGEHFIGLFNAAGKQFAGLVVGILPTLIVLLTFMYALIAFIGEERVTRAVQWS